MSIEVQIIKDIPTNQINEFEDRVVYNTAVLTREMTKSSSSYPYLTGELARNEIQAPVEGSNKEYGLLSGVKYAKYVWNMENVKWTNSSTKPQWYLTNYKLQKESIINTAINRALRSLK